MSGFLGGLKPEINEERLSSLATFRGESEGIQLRTFWKQFYANENLSSFMFAPVNNNTGDRQEIMLQYNEIPMPVQFQCVDIGEIQDDFGPKIEFDINIEKLAPAHRVKHQHVIDLTLESSTTLTAGEVLTQGTSGAQATVLKTVTGTAHTIFNLRTATWTKTDGHDITGSVAGALNVHPTNGTRASLYTLRRGFTVCMATTAPTQGETLADYIHRLETTTITNTNTSIAAGDDETKKFNYAAMTIGNFSDSSTEQLSIAYSANPVKASHDHNRNFYPFHTSESDLHSGAASSGSAAQDNRLTLDVSPIAITDATNLELGEDYRLIISASASKLDSTTDRSAITFGLFEKRGAKFNLESAVPVSVVDVPCSNAIPFNSRGIKTYTGDNSTTDFAIPVTVEHESHVVVRVDGVVKEILSHYTVNSDVDTISFTSAPATGARIHINCIGAPSSSFGGVSYSSFPRFLTIWQTNDMARYYAVNSGQSAWSTGTVQKAATGHLDSTSTDTGNSGNNARTDKTHFTLSAFDSSGTGEDSIDRARIQDTESIVYLKNISLKEFSPTRSNATNAEQKLNPGISTTALSIKNREEKINSDLSNSTEDVSLLAFGVNTSTQLSGDGNAKYLFFNDFRTNNLNTTSAVTDGQVVVGYSHDENKLGNIFNKNSLNDSSIMNGLEYGDGDAIDSVETNGIDNFTQKGFLKLNWNVSGLNGGDDGASFDDRECVIASARVKDVISIEGGGTSPESTVLQVDDPSVFECASDEEYVIYKMHGDYSDVPGDTGTSAKNTVSNTASKNISGITAANPAVVTCTGHGFNTGDCVLIESTAGTTSMNDRYYHVTKVDANSFQCTGFTNSQSYTSGGTAKKVTVDMRTGLKVIKIEGDLITFDKHAGFGDYYYSNTYGDSYTAQADREHLLNDLNSVKSTNFSSVMISPRRFWLYMQVNNYNATNKINNPTWGASSVLITESTGTAGATWNESLFSDSRSYANAWRLTPDETTTTLELTKDYGFGNIESLQNADQSRQLKDITDIGILNKFEPVVNEYNEIEFEKLVELDDPEDEEDITFMVSPVSTDTRTLTYHSRTGTYKPMFVSVFEDKIPVIDDFEVNPDEDDAFFPKFSWKSQDKDLWYGFIMVDDNSIYNQYENAILHYPLNESGTHGGTISAPTEKISGTTTAISGAVYDIEGLAGNAVRFDGNDYVRSGTGSADPFGGALTEASFVMHVVHDNANIAADQHILYKNEVIEVKVNNNDVIEAHLYWDTDSYVALQSTSLMVADGETPMNIIVTLDSTLTSGNAKLFINGKLEDQSGLAISSDASNEQAGWLRGTGLENNNNQLFIGSANGSTGWDGKIEEVVVYNKAIYPFTGKDNEFLFTKPVKELQDTTVASSRSYVGKIFLKDYHNIRGKTVKEVATAPQVAFKKAAFRIDGA